MPGVLERRRSDVLVDRVLVAVHRADEHRDAGVARGHGRDHETRDLLGDDGSLREGVLVDDAGGPRPAEKRHRGREQLVEQLHLRDSGPLGALDDADGGRWVLTHECLEQPGRCVVGHGRPPLGES